MATDTAAPAIPVLTIVHDAIMDIVRYLVDGNEIATIVTLPLGAAAQARYGRDVEYLVMAVRGSARRSTLDRDEAHHFARTMVGDRHPITMLAD